MSLAVVPLAVVLGAPSAKGNFEADSIPGSASEMAGFTFWYNGMAWCNHGSGQLLFDDFNGDGRVDMLCHDWATGEKAITYARPGGRFVYTDWYKAMGWCNHQGSQLVTGDFNRDGRADLLCHDMGTGAKWISFARPGGVFEGTDWFQSMAWCNHPAGRISVADFNGDGRDDLVCHDLNTGEKWYAYSTF